MQFFLSIILSLISFICVLINVQAHEYDPLILKMDVDSPEFLRLPTTNIPSFDDEDIIVSCPTSVTEIKKNLEAISENFYQAKSCVFQTPVDVNQNVFTCKEKVEPSLELQYEPFTIYPKLCGFSESQILFKFGFYHCGSALTSKQLIEPQEHIEKLISPVFFPIYDLCIDINNGEVFWTKHNIMTPAILLNHEENKDKISQDPNEVNVEISTNAFFFENNIFTNLKEKYAANQNGDLTLKKTFIVPEEHIAPGIWRKTVTHFMNVVPVWSSHRKFMSSINDGIKKIALELYLQNRRLTVYTRVENTEYEEINQQEKAPFESNIWYRLLYDDRTQYAALIIYHNTLAIPKERKCGHLMDCKSMPYWHEDAEDSEESIRPVLDQGVYAYCCEPNAEEIQNIFNLYLEIGGSLNLNEFFPFSQN